MNIQQNNTNDLNNVGLGGEYGQQMTAADSSKLQSKFIKLNMSRTDSKEEVHNNNEDGAHTGRFGYAPNPASLGSINIQNINDHEQHNISIEHSRGNPGAEGQSLISVYHLHP